MSSFYASPGFCCFCMTSTERCICRKVDESQKGNSFFLRREVIAVDDSTNKPDPLFVTPTLTPAKAWWWTQEPKEGRDGE